jgi:hypothetical protein
LQRFVVPLSSSQYEIYHEAGIGCRPATLAAKDYSAFDLAALFAIGTGVLDSQQGRKGHEGALPQATARSVVVKANKQSVITGCVH